MPPAAPKQFLALYAYSPRPGAHELRLEQGDVLTVTGQSDQYGFVEATLRGATGFVPSSHLEPVQAASDFKDGGQATASLLQVFRP